MKQSEKKAFTPVRVIVRFLVYFLLGWLLLTHNPFGLADNADRAFQNAYINWTAPFYNETAQEDIVLVTLNSNTIRYLYDKDVIQANSWPLLYKDHATILKYILEAAPKAVFVDIYFKDKRSTDPTHKHLLNLIKRANSKSIPLFFAQGYEYEEFTDMQTSLDVHGGLAVNGWKDYSNRYALKLDKEESIAYRLYKIACLGDRPLESCSPSTLNESDLSPQSFFSVQWGDKAGRVAFPQYSDIQCKSPLRQLKVAPNRIDRMLDTSLKMLSGFFRGWMNSNDADFNPCMYHSVIQAEHIVDITKSINIDQGCSKNADLKLDNSLKLNDAINLCRSLNDKIVIYTIDIEAATDKFSSPVHGIVPGANRHAMALDNLIANGSEITYKTDDRLEMINTLVWALVVAVILLREIGFLPGFMLINQRFEHHRLDYYMWGLLPIILASFAYHFLGSKHYEPMNLLTYLVMVLMLTELIKNEFARKLIDFLENLNK